MKYRGNSRQNYAASEFGDSLSKFRSSKNYPLTAVSDKTHLPTTSELLAVINLHFPKYRPQQCWMDNV